MDLQLAQALGLEKAQFGSSLRMVDLKETYLLFTDVRGRLQNRMMSDAGGAASEAEKNVCRVIVDQVTILLQRSALRPEDFLRKPPPPPVEASPAPAAPAPPVVMDETERLIKLAIARSVDQQLTAAGRVISQQEFSALVEAEYIRLKIQLPSQVAAVQAAPQQLPDQGKAQAPQEQLLQQRRPPASGRLPVGPPVSIQREAVEGTRSQDANGIRRQESAGDLATGPDRYGGHSRAEGRPLIGMTSNVPPQSPVKQPEKPPQSLHTSKHVAPVTGAPGALAPAVETPAARAKTAVTQAVAATGAAIPAAVTPAAVTPAAMTPTAMPPAAFAPSALAPAALAPAVTPAPVRSAPEAPALPNIDWNSLSNILKTVKNEGQALVSPPAALKEDDNIKTEAMDVEEEEVKEEEGEEEVVVKIEADPFDDLTDEELVSLLKNFKTLSQGDQSNLVCYMKKMEQEDPHRVQRLKIETAKARRC